MPVQARRDGDNILVDNVDVKRAARALLQQMAAPGWKPPADIGQAMEVVAKMAGFPNLHAAIAQASSAPKPGAALAQAAGNLGMEWDNMSPDAFLDIAERRGALVFLDASNEQLASLMRSVIPTKHKLLTLQPTEPLGTTWLDAVQRRGDTSTLIVDAEKLSFAGVQAVNDCLAAGHCMFLQTSAKKDMLGLVPMFTATINADGNFDAEPFYPGSDAGRDCGFAEGFLSDTERYLHDLGIDTDHLDKKSITVTRGPVDPRVMTDSTDGIHPSRRAGYLRGISARHNPKLQVVIGQSEPDIRYLDASSYETISFLRSYQGPVVDGAASVSLWFRNIPEAKMPAASELVSFLVNNPDIDCRLHFHSKADAQRFFASYVYPDKGLVFPSYMILGAFHQEEVTSSETLSNGEKPTQYLVAPQRASWRRSGVRAATKSAYYANGPAASAHHAGGKPDADAAEPSPAPVKPTRRNRP